MCAPTQPSLFRQWTLCSLTGITCFVFVQGAFAAEPAPGANVTMRWRNGDTLRGDLLESGENTIRFAAKPFATPLDLTLGQLGGIRFPTLGAQEASITDQRFEITLKNGDRLEGRLVAISPDTITFECDSLGTVAIKRSEVTRIAQTKGGQTIFPGLGELSDWSSSGRDRKPTDWFIDVRGELTTHQWSGNLYRKIALPERVEVHFKVQFPQGMPNFEIGLLREPQDGPMLETWDNVLVLTHLTQFAPVMELTSETRELDLRLFWNRTSGELILCDASGKKLASLDDAKNNDVAKMVYGFSILNHTPQIKLLSLSIHEWDGLPVPVVDLTKPRLHLRNAPIRFEVNDVSLAEGDSSLKVGEKSFPLDDLLEMILSPDPAGNPAEFVTSTRIAWHSGSTLSGAFLQFGSDAIKMIPAWSDLPVTASLREVREIRFPEKAEPPAYANDLLTSGEISLRGTMRLAPPGSKDGLIFWQLPGASSAVPIAPESKVRIARGPLPNDGDGPQTLLSLARLYLDTDEILSGKFLSISAEQIEFESRITGKIAIPSTQVRALDTGTAGRLLEGFGDPEWVEIENVAEDVVLTPKNATLKSGGFGNSSILLGDRIRFDAEWKKSHGAMTLRLFASGPDESAPSTDIIFAAQGNRLFIGKLNENGAFSFSGDQIPIVDNKASLELTLKPKAIDIRIDGKISLSLSVDPGRVSGNGLYFKMGGGWQGANQEDSTIMIHRFQIENSPGSIPRRIIDNRAKEHVLAIPRASRDPLPSHLLIAPNGDLLRGRLESGTPDFLRFTVNKQTIEIPGNRISTLVRLRPPVETAAIIDGDSGHLIDPFSDEHYPDLKIFSAVVSHQIVLRDGTRLQLSGDRIEGNRLIGTSAVLGTCSVSLENIQEIRCTPPVPIHQTEPMDVVAFDDWQSVLTPDPEIPNAEDQPKSPLIGKTAPLFELNRLDDSVFKLGDHRGKVVVLDFWATWCGPCIKAMPDVIKTVAAFPEGVVEFCAVNQAETTPIIRDFLEKRKWENSRIALDFNMKVSQAYNVKGIPHTIMIDPEGKIAWVHTGYSADLGRELFEAIAKVLSR